MSAIRERASAQQRSEDEAPDASTALPRMSPLVPTSVVGGEDADDVRQGMQAEEARQAAGDETRHRLGDSSTC